MSKRRVKDDVYISNSGSWMNVLTFVVVGGEPRVGLEKNPGAVR